MKLIKRWLATHPSLESRIQRLWPALDMDKPLLPRAVAPPVSALASVEAVAGDAPVLTSADAAPERSARAPLLVAFDAMPLEHWLWALLLATDPAARNQQLTQLSQWFGTDTATAVQTLSATWLAGQPEQRLAALNLLAGRLRHGQFERCLEQALELICLDDQVEPFELIAYQLLLSHQPSGRLARRPNKADVAKASAQILRFLARDCSDPGGAFRSAVGRLRTAADCNDPTAVELLAAISTLAAADDSSRKALLDAAAHCMDHDGVRATNERATLAALSEALGCPSRLSATSR